MASPANGDDFVVLITDAQARLYAYVLSLLGDPHRAADVLQNTNLVLWRKADEFKPGTDFNAWAYSVAHYQVLAERQKIAREQLIFDDSLLAELSEKTTRRSAGFNARLNTLHGCMKKLLERQRDLLERHYAEDQSIDEIAAARGETPGAVAQALFRARLTLTKCIEENLKQDDD
jgi:RNA polymerase sigma-70 factor (ECF subfamily)